MTRAFFISLLTALSCLASSGLQAQFPVLPSADLVLGQPDFTTKAIPAVTQSSLRGTEGIAVDPVSGKVFVSVAGSHRILRFASGAALVNGANAEAVIGQPDYTSAITGLSATRMNAPSGIDIDAAGRLWVADYRNHRVLMFEDAANLPEFDAAATLVLGQADFSSNLNATSQVGMTGPAGVHVDAAGRLWVVDYDSHRVTMFADAASLDDGAPATLVLGQPDFDTATSGTSDVKMYQPLAAVVDSAGRLWVADQSNHRVLRFDNAASLASGAPANVVLGQPDFVTRSSNNSAGKFSSPAALAFDRNGTLYISVYFRNRVVYYRNPATKSNEAIPDGVIGQADLVNIDPGTTAQILDGPYAGLDFDAAGRLWVNDYDNNRVLRFPGDFIATSPVLTGKAPKSVTKGTLALKGTATDPNGIAEIRFRVGKGPFKTAVGTTAWKLSAKLKPGKNTIEIVMVDAVGNVSAARLMKVKRG